MQVVKSFEGRRLFERSDFVDGDLASGELRIEAGIRRVRNSSDSGNGSAFRWMRFKVGRGFEAGRAIDGDLTATEDE